MRIPTQRRYDYSRSRKRRPWYVRFLRALSRLGSRSMYRATRLDD